LFSDTIPVEEAQAFVDKAFKKAEQEVAKIKQRPSKVAFSFYADKDVNAVIKARKQKPTKNAPAILPGSALQKVNAKQPAVTQTQTQLVKYYLQCEHVRKVTFINCNTLHQTSTGTIKIPRLYFKQIQLRQNNRLNILIEPPNDVATTSNINEYNLQCKRNNPELYQYCKRLPGAWAVNSPSEGMAFRIEQMKMDINRSQFEILVEQTIKSKPKKRPQTTVAKAPLSAPQTATGEWVETYVDPKPISFKVLMLRDNSLLLSADQESLKNDLEKTLGKNYIDHDDYVLTPGEFKFVNFTRIDPDTRYVGIIADYRDSTHAIWKKAFKVEPTGSIYPLHVHLKRKEVDILSEK